MAFGNVNVPGRAHLEHKQAEEALTARISAVESSVASHTHTAAQVGAVPTTRKVNNKVLSADISLTASDVGARPSTWTPTAAAVGAKASDWKPFYAGTSAPSDKTQLWIDTDPNNGGLKYWNGSAWVKALSNYAT